MQNCQESKPDPPFPAKYLIPLPTANAALSSAKLYLIVHIVLHKGTKNRMNLKLL